MKESILTFGSAHLPSRFWLGRVVQDEAKRNELEQAGWITYVPTDDEIAALVVLGGEGCFGDWKDSFHTMYGKVIKREK